MPPLWSMSRLYGPVKQSKRILPIPIGRCCRCTRPRARDAAARWRVDFDWRRYRDPNPAYRRIANQDRDHCAQVDFREHERGQAGRRREPGGGATAFGGRVAPHAGPSDRGPRGRRKMIVRSRFVAWALWASMGAWAESPQEAMRKAMDASVALQRKAVAAMQIRSEERRVG